MLRLRIKSFELAVSYPFIALCAVVLISSRFTGYLYCALAVIIHEAGHLTTMLLCGVKTTGMRITAFNIVINESRRFSVKAVYDFLITLAGPLFNLIFCAAVFGFAPEFAMVNLFIGAFNLLPAAGLDGGQLLYLALVKAFSPRKSALIIDIITFVISLPLMAMGIFVLFHSKYNFSLLFLSIYLILSVFLKDGKYV